MAHLEVRVPANAYGGRAVVVRGRGLPARSSGDSRLGPGLAASSANDPHANAAHGKVAAESMQFDARKIAAAEADL